MRPVQKGTNPKITGDFTDYALAKPDLISRLGPYCSYCERRYPSMLAVEHIQAKAAPCRPDLERRWSNFLLACVNCNSCKGDECIDLAQILLPDRDNTSRAYDYLPDGSLSVRATLTADQKTWATATLRLTGLDLPIREARDSNGKLIDMDRIADRKTIYEEASDSLIDLRKSKDPVEARKSIAKTAKYAGFFSVWMTVFDSDELMKKELIAVFLGTEANCCLAPFPVHPGNAELSDCSKL